MRSLIAFIASAVPAAAQPYVWAEAEAGPAPFAVRAGPPAVLSGGRWLAAAADADELPAGGVTLSLKLPVEAFGTFDVWARVGYEFARGPFRWRVDGGAWSGVPPTRLTTDLMAAGDAEVAWLRLGSVPLAAGTRTLELHWPKPTAGRFLFGLDCVCASRAAFRPNGPHKPDDPWQTPADAAAAESRFALPSTASPDRAAVSLGGTWQAARLDEPGDVEDRTGPVKEIPEGLHWKAARVPADFAADRPEWAYCHRFAYRCRVEVPAAPAGRAFVLSFPNNALLSTVFVNGARVGFGDTPGAGFDVDCTAAVVPGAVNEIVVAVKDRYYGVARTADGKSCRHLFHLPPRRFLEPGENAPTRYADFPAVSDARRSGILEAPLFSARGPVYARDVFVASDVAAGTVTVTPTLNRPSPITVVIRDAAGAEAARGSGDGPVTLSLKNPRPWWPDDPHLYTAEVTVGDADRSIAPFGFCRWGVKGREMTLNGIPWHLRGDLRHAAAPAKPDGAVKEWRKSGQNSFTFRGDLPWAGGTQDATLHYFDRAGVAVRRAAGFETPFAVTPDGKLNKPLFDNWRKQLAARVTADRNHPSLCVWSLDEPAPGRHPDDAARRNLAAAEFAAAAALVRQLDPTRPVSVATGADPLVRDVVLPAAADPSKAARDARFLLRWNDTPAFQLHRDGGPVPENDRAWQPVCVLCRDAAATLPAGGSATRTLKAFNDTRLGTPITVHWLLRVKTTPAETHVRGKKVLSIPPGGSEQFDFPVAVPDAAADAEWVFTCERGGREVFRDAAPCKVVNEK